MPTTFHTERLRLGAFGEELAARHLAEDGLTVIARNWRCADGELDIIARADPSTLVFCEVKTRRSTRHGTPFDAVDEFKERRIHRLAARWVREGRHRAERMRFDVIGVEVTPERAVLRHRRWS